MPNLITYELTENGTIPTYVIDGGYFPNGKILLGYSNEIESNFANKEELHTYLQSYTQNWTEPKTYPNDEDIAFDINSTVDTLWDKITL